jgi:hypothetical protein
MVSPWFGKRLFELGESEGVWVWCLLGVKLDRERRAEACDADAVFSKARELNKLRFRVVANRALARGVVPLKSERAVRPELVEAEGAHPALPVQVELRLRVPAHRKVRTGAVGV